VKKLKPNEKEPAVSSYRPRAVYTNSTICISSVSPSVKGKGQRDYDTLQSSRTRVFDWLALEAVHRGKSWTRKRLGHVAWIKSNLGNNTRVLHWVRFHWYGLGVLRLTNKSGLCLPKSFWHRWSPEPSEPFELSLLPEELLGMDPKKFFDFVEWHNDPRETFPGLRLDFATGFDGRRYSWTKAAWEQHESGRKVSE
jgi:hypothetical protein